MAASIAHHALGLPRRTGGVENIERIGRVHRFWVRLAPCGARLIHQRRPVMVARAHALNGMLFTLQNDAMIRFVL